MLKGPSPFFIDSLLQFYWFQHSVLVLTFFLSVIPIPFYCIVNAWDFSSVSVFSWWPLPLQVQCALLNFCFQYSHSLCFLHYFYLLISNSLFPSTLGLVFSVVFIEFMFPPIFCLCFPGSHCGIFWFSPIVWILLYFFKWFSFFLFKVLHHLHPVGFKDFII